ncbi:Fic family protein [Paenibacillus frigoriresistens]|uniref:Fic family protein n=1 Tax=Paenibacillus alginolyticus TaxID=59839 RepID=UPI0015639213|nr:Fic family protein [Paenibacillus frigoriresistens]NRF95402.1 Fic family protein [Paenibacillus frigoriresistens]
MDFVKIDHLKRELDDLRPLPSAAVRNLDEVYRVEWTYNSNAIEGNTLTLLETKLVLEEGLTIGGKKLHEHFEVINHSEAINYVQDVATQNIELTEYVIKSVHQLVLKNIDDENAGRYRMINVMISGSQHTPPHFTVVPEQMEKLYQWYHEQKDKLHPVELAAQFHFRFVYIHPFADGNGRTARLLMNLILMAYGFPPAIVKAENDARLKYYVTLEKASIGNDLGPFVELIAGCVEDSLQRYIGAVK